MQRPAVAAGSWHPGGLFHGGRRQRSSPAPLWEKRRTSFLHTTDSVRAPSAARRNLRAQAGRAAPPRSSSSSELHGLLPGSTNHRRVELDIRPGRHGDHDYEPPPCSTCRWRARLLRPGGIVVHETNRVQARALPGLPRAPSSAGQPGLGRARQLLIALLTTRTRPFAGGRGESQPPGRASAVLQAPSLLVDRAIPRSWAVRPPDSPRRSSRASHLEALPQVHERLIHALAGHPAPLSAMARRRRRKRVGDHNPSSSSMAARVPRHMNWR
jgi:hypothetical protein